MNKQRVLFAVTLILTAIFISSTTAAITAKTTKWKDEAKAAYTMIHDDLCDGSTPGITGVADTVAYNRGIVLGSGAIVQECENNNFYDRLKTFASHGHEIVSHSWSHVDATQGWNADQEIVKSKATLEQKLEGINITFFIFPFDNYDTKALNALDAAGYISARAGPAPYGGDRGVVTNLAQFKPFGGVLFDVWGPSQSIYKTQDCLQKHVEAAISGGGWSVQEFHGVEDGSWEKISAAEYRKHLDYLKTRIAAGDVWVGTPSQVVRYIMTYNKCGTVSLSNNTLKFSSASSIPAKYAGPITVVLTFDKDESGIEVKQGTEKCPVTKVSTTKFYVFINPAKGDATISTGTGTIVKSIVTIANSVSINKNTLLALIPKGDYSVEIRNLNGQILNNSIQGSSDGNRQTIHLPVNSLGAGFYLAKLTYNGGSVTHKFMITR